MFMSLNNRSLPMPALIEYKRRTGVYGGIELSRSLSMYGASGELSSFQLFGSRSIRCRRSIWFSRLFLLGGFLFPLRTTGFPFCLTARFLSLKSFPLAQFFGDPRFVSPFFHQAPLQPDAFTTEKVTHSIRRLCSSFQPV